MTEIERPPAEPIDADNDDDVDDLDEDEETAEPGEDAQAEPEIDEDELDELDEEEDAEGGAGADGNLAEGIGRAAAVLKYIVERIVDEPDQIAIGAATDDRGPVLLLRVAADDRGRIIGRQGRIVQAIRTIVKAATIGTGERVNVEILD